MVYTFRGLVLELDFSLVLKTVSDMEPSNTEIAVRPIKDEDLDTLFTILKKAFRKEIEIGGFDSQRFERNTKLYRLTSFLMPVFDFFHKDYPTILVATLEDKVVGAVHLVPLGKEIWTIDSLAVDPASSRRGIGYSLIKGSVEHIMKRRGKKALSSIRTDNVPALRIAEKLGFSAFQKTYVLFQEIKRLPNANIHQNVLVRKFQPTDAEEVFKVCKVADPTKTKAYNMSPKDFLTSPLEWVLNRMLQLRSEKLVLEVEGRIVGYTHVTYTSQHEAAKIESFCLPPSPDFPRLAEALLICIMNFLAKKNIKKVIVRLNQKREETIETIKQKGFRPLASFYEITKKLN